MKRTAVIIKRARSPAAPLVMTVDPDRTRLAAPPATPPNDDGNAFLQERLAYVGKVHTFIGLSFYLTGNIADVLLAGIGDVSVSEHLVRRTADFWTWIVPAVSTVYVAQWALCRRARLPLYVLRLIDAVSTLSAASLHSLMVFSHAPGEIAGLSHARALLLFTFGLIIRSIAVPSSPAHVHPCSGGSVCSGRDEPRVVQRSTAIHGFARHARHLYWTLVSWDRGRCDVRLARPFGLRQQVRDASQLGQYTLLGCHRSG